MKSLLAICMIIATPLVWAGENPVPVAPAADVVNGQVLEVRDVESYTYLRLKTQDGETWAAVGKTPVSRGDEVTITNVMVMNNFESKSLNKTFQTILFGTLGGAEGSAPDALGDMSKAHAGLSSQMDAGDVDVPRASGANARTVGEIMMQGAELKDKPVRVRGKIVKYNPNIMGKNWIHLRDGSGAVANNTNDMLVTTTNQAKMGDVVTVQGIVRTDKDFGSGYVYAVLIEEATLQQ